MGSLTTFIETFTDPSKLFSLILFILFTLNFLLNIENEIKIAKITGYNRKIFNPLFLLFLGLSSITILTFYFFDYKSSNFKTALLNELWISILIMCISFIIIACIAANKKNKPNEISFFQLNSKQIIFIGVIFAIIDPFIGCSLRFLNFNLNNIEGYFNFSTDGIFSMFILIFGIAYISSIIFMKITKFSKSEQKFTFYKNDNILDTTVQGYIISETKNHIIMEKDGKLSKYNKSDIFSIKEI